MSHEEWDSENFSNNPVADFPGLVQPCSGAPSEYIRHGKVPQWNPNRVDGYKLSRNNSGNSYAKQVAYTMYTNLFRESNYPFTQPPTPPLEFWVYVILRVSETAAISNEMAGEYLGIRTIFEYKKISGQPDIPKDEVVFYHEVGDHVGKKTYQHHYILEFNQDKFERADKFLASFPDPKLSRSRNTLKSMINSRAVYPIHSEHY